MRSEVLTALCSADAALCIMHTGSAFTHLGLSDLRLVPLLGLLQLCCLVLAELCCLQLTAWLLLAAVPAPCTRPTAAAAWPIRILCIVITAAGAVTQWSVVIIRLCCVQGVNVLQLLAYRTAARRPARAEQ
jgi:hypothetical protein